MMANLQNPKAAISIIVNVFDFVSIPVGVGALFLNQLNKPQSDLQITRVARVIPSIFLNRLLENHGDEKNDNKDTSQLSYSSSSSQVILLLSHRFVKASHCLGASEYVRIMVDTVSGMKKTI
jgi:hypothetical protein